MAPLKTLSNRIINEVRGINHVIGYHPGAFFCGEWLSIESYGGLSFRANVAEF